MSYRTKQRLLALLRQTLRGWVTGAIGFACLGAHACGPNFPNWLLDGTDAQILSAPIASFAVEIRKLDLPISPYVARPSASTERAADSRDSELADLRQALLLTGLPTEEVNEILKAHAGEREELLSFLQVRQSCEKRSAWTPDKAGQPPALPNIKVVKGIPREFADYFRGALAWHAGDTNGARTAWTALLELPAAERRFKSVWAAYMLGRSWEESRPGKAERYYQWVRRYVDDGMIDSAGLASASIGREALIHYRAGDCGQAIDLYLQQAATGDTGALISLRLTAAKALWKRHRSLKALARNPDARRVITAYLIASVFPAPPVHLDGPIRETTIDTLAKVTYFRTSVLNWHQYEQAAILWLEAVEGANIEKTEEAELLALAAYQAGKFETAARWLDKAPQNTLALWLHAKLLLRDGELDEAAACLALIVRSLHEEAQVDLEPLPTTSLDGLGFAFHSLSDATRAPKHAALGELGALRLVQNDYTEALDALLRSGFWTDAAYVAERILTVNELKSYVELNWTEVESRDVDDESIHWRNAYRQRTSNQRQRSDIRYLLARRLTRLDRHAEARPFFPASVRAQFDELDASLKLGRSEGASRAERASALWTAAQILRTNGMELVGTEVEPDWAIHGGSYEVGVTSSDRTNSVVLPPTRDERMRAEEHGISPNRRFHYRYIAASVAWEAAELMPDNTDETAFTLYTAGCWLKTLDPMAADLFYKALVNRCGNTALGGAADEKRWFPSDPEVETLNATRSNREGEKTSRD